MTTIDPIRTRTPSPGICDVDASPLTPSTTSTLISTPHMKPLPAPPVERLMKFVPPPLDLGNHFAQKAGRNIQPHASNLPRRKKAPKKSAEVQAPLPSSLSSSVRLPESSTGNDLGADEPLSNQENERAQDQITQNLALAEADNVRPTFERANANPPLMNLPRRRRKPLTPEQRSIQRAYRRCLQEIGEGSGVFLAFTDVDDEEEQSSAKLRSLGGVGFSHVVRVCVAETVPSTENVDAANDDHEDSEDNWHGPYWQEDEHTLRLYVAADEAHDDGNTHLHEGQLKYTCQFLQRASSNSDKILITTPLDRAADGMSLALLYLAYTRRFVPPPVAYETPSSAARASTSYMITRTPSMASSLTYSMSQHAEASSRIHALLMHLHDESCDDLEEAYGHVLAAAARRGASSGVVAWNMGSGLRMEWRGVLSREGVDCLDEILESLTVDSS